jgi:hypothetical protein
VRGDELVITARQAKRAADKLCFDECGCSHVAGIRGGEYMAMEDSRCRYTGRIATYALIRQR